MTDFGEAVWIWYTDSAKPDTYGDFKDSFFYGGGKALCRISCDGDYTLLVNGVYVSSGQYGDFEHYKIYDCIDITEFLHKGKNTVDFTVWHFGISSSRYKSAQAGLLYSIECDGKAVCKSSVNTLSRENPNYKSGLRKAVTSQLGLSFLFDANAADKPYGKAVTVNKCCQMYSRPIEKAILKKTVRGQILKAEKNRYLLDIGEEAVGLPTLSLYSETAQKITVSWGEHLTDGRVPRRIGVRDFSFEYIAKKGDNRYTNYMLRLGCRYIEIGAEAEFDLYYAGIIPQIYPVEAVDKRFDDPLKQKVYDASVNTLRLCLMEHYVDTPWREQSLYAYDSRNQMLCGYKAFKNKNREYARANLILISKDRRKDGLLSLTYPSEGELAIPSFSLHYFTAVREYIDCTDDLSAGYEIYPKLLSIAEAFEKKISNGLLHKFTDKAYWNFYDWSPCMDEGIGVESKSEPDLMINCLFVIALENLNAIADKIGERKNFSKLIGELRHNIKNAFFSRESGLFSMTENGKEFTELGNSVALLAGIADSSEAEAIAEKLCEGSLAECSLSMKCFKCDALLKVDESYRESVIDEILRSYAPMLESGSTVWEVKEGAEAFDAAGSLCHGWSAIPILYL